MADGNGERRESARLVWAMLVGLAVIVFTIAGGWVASMERRMSAVESEGAATREQVRNALTAHGEMRDDIRAMLSILRQRP